MDRRHRVPIAFPWRHVRRSSNLTRGYIIHTKLERLMRANPRAHSERFLFRKASEVDENIRTTIVGLEEAKAAI